MRKRNFELVPLLAAAESIVVAILFLQIEIGNELEYLCDYGQLKLEKF